MSSESLLYFCADKLDSIEDDTATIIHLLQQIVQLLEGKKDE